MSALTEIETPEFFQYSFTLIINRVKIHSSCTRERHPSSCNSLLRHRDYWGEGSTHHAPQSHCLVGGQSAHRSVVRCCARRHSFININVEAYPGLASTIIEVDVQFPGASTEEVERQVTVPLELALTGMPGLKYTRSGVRFRDSLGEGPGSSTQPRQLWQQFSKPVPRASWC